MENGRIVVNEQGQRAWWDGKNLTPVRVDIDKTQPGAAQDEEMLKGPMQVTNQPPRGRVVVNDRGDRAWWDGTNLKPLALGQAEQQQADVKNSEATGASLMGFPAPSKVEPLAIDKRPMSAVSNPNIDFQTGKVKMIPGAPQESAVGNVVWPIANAATQFFPGGRLAHAAYGAGMSAAEDIAQGKTPSLTGMGIGAASSLVPEALLQGGKWAARTLSKGFGKEPLREGGKLAAEQVMKRAPSVAEASAEFAGTKAMTTPAPIGANSQFEREANAILAKGKRTGLDKNSTELIQKELSDLGTAINSGEPLSYGEIFTRAKSLREQATTATTSEGKIALKKLHDAYLNDLSAIGPEAKQAVQHYRLAKSAESAIEAASSGTKARLDKVLEKYGGDFTQEEIKNLQAIRRHVGPEWNSYFRQAAVAGGLLGAGGYLAGIPGLSSSLAPGVVMSALVHLPGGYGVALARSLVSPEGTISKNVAPAIAQAVRSYIQGKQNGND